MRTSVFSLAIAIILLSGCKETVDPRFYNDAMHGSITGIVNPIGVNAMVYVNQINIVDSMQVDPSTGVFEFHDLEIGNYNLKIVSDDYRTWKREHVNVEGAGTNYLGEIELVTIPDKVESFYPEDKSEIVYNNRYSGLSISVVFNTPMDRESVEAAFSTDPPTEGIFTWGTYARQPYPIYWYDDSYLLSSSIGGSGAAITTYSKVKSFTYRIVQRDSYVDTTYKVTLGIAAKDTAGNALRFPMEFSFSTIQSSQSTDAIVTQPAHGDIEVPPIAKNGIRITFPRKMDKESTESAIKINPALSDVFYLWPGDNVLTIYTGGLYKAGAEYSVKIDSTAKDADGEKMGMPYTFSFETAEVAVTSTSPQNGEVYAPYNKYITLTFNSYIDINTLNEGFKISPAVDGHIEYYTSYSETTFRFYPNGNFAPNTKYTVTIESTVKDIMNQNLSRDHVFSFVTRP